uniref:Glutathione peroxidase n=1 Tax=Ditylenchus dipsaci TaxID=166011 RepID=A0A915DZI6_9BILA
MATDIHSIYQFNALNANNTEVSMNKYIGMVLIIVNVASQCGLTNSNYKQLKQIQDKYKHRGLAIAAFPSNQFNGQVTELYFYQMFS